MKFFALSEHHTSVKTEVLAGLTTFSTMAYILIVNPQILSQTGMDFGAVMVATALAAALGTWCMGLLANYPFALAPGMGLNAYFTYGIVLGSGFSWQIALGTCFYSGLLFLLLTISGIREKIMHAIPASLRLATTGGIGLLLAFIGMKNVGLITPHKSTLVGLGEITRPEILLTALGILVTGALMARGIRGAILIGILFNWLVGLLTGLVEWKGVVSAPPSLSPTFLQLDLVGALSPECIPIILSFAFVSLFDTAGTLLGLSEQGGFLTPKGHLPHARRALVNDAIGTMGGALFGTSALTTYLESASGINVGGRTGLTAVVVASLFLLSLFFAPLASAIPFFATAPVMMIVGALLLQQIKKIDWSEPTEYIPAFIILLTIPLTYSIATGIALGFLLYPLLKLLSGRGKEVLWIVWVLGLLFGLRFAYL